MHNASSSAPSAAKPAPAAADLPLTGIKVIDLSEVFAFPSAGMHLADQGAEVIKIEPPRGDDCRNIFTTPAIAGQSRAFWALNRNKRGMGLDLRQKAGREVLDTLLRNADVLLINMREEAARKLELDGQTLSARYPRLIYAILSAYGSEGPLKNERGYDLLLQALSGLSGRRAMPNGRPRTLGAFAVDLGAGMLAAYSIMLALWQRRSSGRGQRVECSLLGSALALQIEALVRCGTYEAPGEEDDFLLLPSHSAYRCADGVFMQLAVTGDAQWQALCRALTRPQWAAEPYHTAEGRRKHAPQLAESISARFAEADSATWRERLRSEDVPATEVLAPAEVFDHPQIRANRFMHKLTQPGVGEVEMTAVPFTLEHSPAASAYFTPSPRFGEHTAAIMREHGYSEAQCDALREAGVTFEHEPAP